MAELAVTFAANAPWTGKLLAAGPLVDLGSDTWFFFTAVDYQKDGGVDGAPCPFLNDSKGKMYMTIMVGTIAFGVLADVMSAYFRHATKSAETSASAAKVWEFARVGSLTEDGRLTDPHFPNSGNFFHPLNLVCTLDWGPLEGYVFSHRPSDGASSWGYRLKDDLPDGAEPVKGRRMKKHSLIKKMDKKLGNKSDAVELAQEIVDEGEYKMWKSYALKAAVGILILLVEDLTQLWITYDIEYSIKPAALEECGLDPGDTAINKVAQITMLVTIGMMVVRLGVACHSYNDNKDYM